MDEPFLPPLAVSMGEPAGIGPDLLLQIYAGRERNGVTPFIVFGQAAFLRNRAARLGLDLDIQPASPDEAPRLFPAALPVFEVEGLVPDKPGKPSPVSAAAVQNAIAEAVKATMAGACRGLVTAPIHKGVLYTSGFKYPGHTEYLAALCAADGDPPRHPVMLLVHGDLRVAPLTVHVPLSAVPGLVTPALINSAAKTLIHDLRTRFGISEPRIGVAGLNPHGGEHGGIGMEELDIIAPAVAELVFEGFDVEGPFPADTLFYPAHWRRYHAVLAMYHDQALIPIKTVAFDKAVNMTLGLPIVRVSPDHGTAFDLAGTGQASSASLLAALRLADRLTAAHVQVHA